MFRQMRKGNLVFSLMVAMLLVLGLGCKKKGNTAPPVNVPIIPTPTGPGGGGGGGGACGNIGPTTFRLSDIPFQFQLGSTNRNVINNLQLFFAEQFNAGEQYYAIVGSGNLVYGDLRAFPQYANQQLQFCVSSTNPVNNTPSRGAYDPKTGQIAINFQSVFNTVVNYNPNGTPIQGQESITVELGSRQGCPAWVVARGQIQGCAIVTVGQSGQAYQYQITSNPLFQQQQQFQQPFQQQPFFRIE